MRLLPVGLLACASFLEAQSQPVKDFVLWQILNAKIVQLDQSGDYDAALKLAKLALSLAEKAVGPDHPATGHSLVTLAGFYDSKGEYAQAEPLYQRALTIHNQTLTNDRPDLGRTLNNFAHHCLVKGDYARARPLYDRALEIFQTISGPDDPKTAHVINGLGAVYEAEGDYVQAERRYQRALDVFNQTSGPEDPVTARVSGNLAALYRKKGDYQRAKKLAERSLAVLEKARGPDHPDTVTAVNNLANIYDSMHDYAHAEPLYERALASSEKVSGRNHPDTAASLNNLALVCQTKGDYDRAESLLKRALAISQESLGPNHPNTANSLNNLAELYRKKSDYTRAAPLYRDALAIREKTLGPNHPDTGGSVSNLAVLAWQTGRVEEAKRDFERTAHINELNLRRVLATGSQPQKQAYLDSLRSDSDAQITFGLKAPGSITLAFNAVVQRKARVLEVVANEANALRRRLPAEDKQKLDELFQTRALLAQMNTMALGGRNLEDYQNELRQLSEKEDRLQADLAARSAEFRTEERSPAPEDLQAALLVKSALIEFVRYRPYLLKDRWDEFHYAAFVLLKSGQAAGLDLGAAKKIDELCSQFILSISSPANRDQTWQIARELDGLVMQPVRALLHGRTEILLSPDGPLNLIPFAALIDEHKHYLVKRYQFTYLGTSRDLLRLRQKPPSRQPVTIVADPAFGRSPNSGGCRFEQRSGFAEEADVIASRIPTAKKALGDMANKSMLQGLAGPRILHVATHAFVDLSGDCVSKDASPMLRSGLALAGANNRDGIITALEIEQLDLWGTQLVVLSACETGAGYASDGEGIFGLRRALVIAGSRTQVISLWEVDDESTRELMAAYYDRLLRGVGRSAALRAVQREMLKDRRPPSAWAAFIPSGDWTPLGP